MASILIRETPSATEGVGTAGTRRSKRHRKTAAAGFLADVINVNTSLTLKVFTERFLDISGYAA